MQAPSSVDAPSPGTALTRPAAASTGCCKSFKHEIKSAGSSTGGPAAAPAAAATELVVAATTTTASFNSFCNLYRLSGSLPRARSTLLAARLPCCFVLFMATIATAICPRTHPDLCFATNCTLTTTLLRSDTFLTHVASACDTPSGTACLRRALSHRHGVSPPSVISTPDNTEAATGGRLQATDRWHKADNHDP